MRRIQGSIAISLKYAGKDASEAYNPIHPPNTLDTYLPKDKHLGPVDMSTVEVAEKKLTDEDRALQHRRDNKPPLSQCLNLYDFEAVAKTTLSAQAWAYCTLPASVPMLD